MSWCHKTSVKLLKGLDRAHLWPEDIQHWPAQRLAFPDFLTGHAVEKSATRCWNFRKKTSGLGQRLGRK